MRIIFLLGLLFGLHVCASAQSAASDSIHKSFRGRITLGGGLDSRNSFINNRRAHIWGIKVAADFGELIQLGIGYNRHDNNLTKTIFFVNATGETDSAQGELHMDYVSWYARYVFYKKGRWKFNIIPFQLGVGRSRYLYSQSGRDVFTNKRSIIVFESGFNVSFKVCKWLGVGGDIGIRWMIKDNPAIPEKFNSPQYSLYFIVYWSEIIRAVAPKNKFVETL